MRIIILALVLLAVGCKGKKEIIREVRDTVIIRDTFTQIILDSIYIIRTVETQSDIKERADSVIIRTVKDTIIVRKYGTSKETASQSKELEELRRVISEMTEKGKHESSSRQVTKDPAVKKKWSFWKWLALVEGGAILVLLGFSGMKYVKLINFSFFKK